MLRKEACIIFVREIYGHNMNRQSAVNAPKVLWKLFQSPMFISALLTFSKYSRWPLYVFQSFLTDSNSNKNPERAKRTIRGRADYLQYKIKRLPKFANSLVFPFQTLKTFVAFPDFSSWSHLPGLALPGSVLKLWRQHIRLGNFSTTKDTFGNNSIISGTFDRILSNQNVWISEEKDFAKEGSTVVTS